MTCHLHLLITAQFKENEMKDYVILFLLVLVFLRGITFIKHGFLIADTDKYIKKLQDKIDNANNTRSKKHLIGIAILLCWIFGAILASLSFYAISSIIKVG